MPESKIYLRKGKFNDAHAVVQLYWRNEKRPKHIEKVSKAMNDLPSVIAEIDGEIAGFVYSRLFAPDILEIDNLFVHENHRNKGIGSQLLREIKMMAYPKYSALILVNSDLYNNPVVDKRDASNFYLRHGFTLALKTSGSRVFVKRLNSQT